MTLFPHRFFVSAIAAIALLPAIAPAQAREATATEAVHLQVYGMGSYLHTRFGAPNTAAGFGVGGAIGFPQRFVPRLEPSLDVRYTYATNAGISQSFYGGGLRLTYNVARLHPYGDIMFGQGNIHFKQVPANSTYTHDNSTVYMYGGGVDVDLTRSIAIRADVQRQRWQLSERTPPFYPIQASAGIRYQFHFHSKYGPE